MKTEGFQLRFIDLPLPDVLSVIREFSIENHMDTIKIKEEENLKDITTAIKKDTKNKIDLDSGQVECYRVEIRGIPPGKFLTNTPKVLTELFVCSLESKTLIYYSVELDEKSLVLIQSVAAIFFCLGAFLPIILLTSSLPVFCIFSPTLLFIPSFMAIAEDVKARLGVNKLQPIFWDKLEESGQRVYSIQEAHDSKNQTGLFATATLFGVISLAFYIFGFIKTALIIAVFIAAPILIGSLLRWTSTKLPFRYKFGADRAELSWSWFLAMFIPNIWFSYLQNTNSMGEFGSSVSSIIVLVYILAAISTPIGYSLEYQVRYRTYLATPSGGAETANVNRLFKFLFFSTGFIFFIFLAAGTIWGISDLYYFFVSYKYSGTAEKLFASINYAWAFIVPNNVAPTLSMVTTALWFTPLIISFVFWIKNLMTVLIVDSGRKPNSKKFLDGLTRDGLYSDILDTIQTGDLRVIVSGTNLVNPYGAAIFIRGVFKKIATIYIDPVIFSIIKDKKQREALLWHEVSHVVKENVYKSVIYDIIFNVWGEQARSTLRDSLEQELGADKFAVDKIGSPQHLIEAFQSLQLAGWGYSPPARSNLLENLVGFYRVLIGEKGMMYVHPNLELRIRTLEGIQ